MISYRGSGGGRLDAIPGGSPLWESLAEMSGGVAILAQCPDRFRSKGAEFLGRAYIDNDQPLAVFESSQQLAPADRLQAFSGAKVGLDEALHSRQPFGSKRAQANPKLIDDRGGQPIPHSRTVPSRRHKPGLFQNLKVSAGVGHRHSDLARELLDASLAVSQHVNDLNPPPTSQRLGDTRELVEELSLDCADEHLSATICLSVRMVKFSIDCLTIGSPTS